jgi:hypothetical protein
MSDWKEQEIINAGAEWAEGLQSGYVDAILRLYDERAVLWGTLSQIRRADHDLIRKYFENLMSHEGIKVEFTSSLIRHYGDIALNTGTYTFSWRDGNRKVSIPSRFSFVYWYSYGNWRIIDHHSSIVPDSPFDTSRYVVET